ncbi:MAG: sigma 54-interacting transcriptional regulator [Firmicutes bacterium]|nr:sigma 54-interacting transcriptional regulator [Bacillota bacterium]
MAYQHDYNDQKNKIFQHWESFFDSIAERRMAHDNYILRGIEPPEHLIDPEIAESWKRSIGYGLDANRIEPVYLKAEELAGKMEECEDLLNAADPILEEFAAHFTSNLFTVDLYDKDLCLIKMYGHPAELKKRPSYIMPGLIRTEQVCGTTSMSYALEKKQAAQLIGGEHFSNDMCENVCTAAPILFEGDCVGLVNVVERQWEMDSRTLGTLASLAKLVEHNYEQQKLREELGKEASLNEGIIKSIPDGLMVISAAGVITKVNRACGKLLGMNRHDVEGMDIDDLFGVRNPFRPVIRLGIPIRDQEISLEIAGGIKRFIGNVQPVMANNQVFQLVVTLRDMKSMHTIIKSVGGWNATYTFENILGSDPVFKQAVEFAEQTAMMDSTVLIEGESGTGKELFAQSIHNGGPFASGPFIAVNCAAIPMSLLESELFGYESGAFTGAKKNGQPGKFELAERGTLFLDEINSIPLDMQVKLLRVLQDKKITRIGGTNSIELHVKIIAASNENLWELVQRGEFRADLFYRLNVITIHIPPLSQHAGDIPLIARSIVERLSQSYDEEIQLTDTACKILMQYSWPGNVRELENVIERGFVNARLRKSAYIDTVDFDKMLNFGEEKPSGESMVVSQPSTNITPLAGEQFLPGSTVMGDLHVAEREIIIRCLLKNKNNISATARELGMARNTLYQRIRKYGIEI